MIEICPFVADVDGAETPLYAVLREDKLVFYEVQNKKAVEFNKKFNLKGFYIQEAKDMWTERIQPLLNMAPPIT